MMPSSVIGSGGKLGMFLEGIKSTFYKDTALGVSCSAQVEIEINFHQMVESTRSFDFFFLCLFIV